MTWQTSFTAAWLSAMFKKAIMTPRNDAVFRIREMETRFDRLLANSPEPDDLSILLDYYENGQWLLDYRLDEQGLLPSDLKRGILSEDGFYNYLQQAKN